MGRRGRQSSCRGLSVTEQHVLGSIPNVFFLVAHSVPATPLPPVSSSRHSRWASLLVARQPLNPSSCTFIASLFSYTMTNPALAAFISIEYCKIDLFKLLKLFPLPSGSNILCNSVSPCVLYCSIFPYFRRQSRLCLLHIYLYFF